MKIDCYLSLGCGSKDALHENIASALGLENIKAEVNFHRIDDARALALGLTGSPSIFINGKELQPQDATGFS